MASLLSASICARACGGNDNYPTESAIFRHLLDCDPMVQIQSSWFPLYDRNPQTFVPNIFFAKSSDYRAATQKVFTGADDSWIGLPVVK
jgi:predicted acyl esterase